MILAEALTKQFDTLTAVDQVDLNVPSGHVLALLGPNGAGKTTTVRMLTSILLPTSGHASVAGFDVVRQPAQVRAKVGVLTEHHGLYNRMNADEYLAFYGALYRLTPEVIRQRTDDWLERFNLAAAKRKRLGEFSKGMRQKLALVRALLHEPPVLLLDEPTSAMDPESARIVRDAIHQLKSDERTIILCTHNLAEAEELADQIAIISKGRILYNGTAVEIKTSLLGPVEYEVRAAQPFNGWTPALPDGMQITDRGEFTLRMTVDDPLTCNPVFLRRLMEHNVEVISFQEVPHSLEKAYLEAMSREDAHAG